MRKSHTASNTMKKHQGQSVFRWRFFINPVAVRSHLERWPWWTSSGRAVEDEWVDLKSHAWSKWTLSNGELCIYKALTVWHSGVPDCHRIIDHRSAVASPSQRSQWFTGFRQEWPLEFGKPFHNAASPIWSSSFNEVLRRTFTRLRSAIDNG